MKRKPIIFVVLFFVILGLFAGMTFGLPQKEFSPNENRYLAQMPELTVENLLSGEFQSQLDAFLSDQIPLREFWIETNTNLKKWLGKTEINGVYFGSDGYYFQQFTEESYSASRKEAVFALLERFAAKQTASVTVMSVPTPGAVLSDKLPANAPMYDADAVWEELKAALSSADFVDQRDAVYKDYIEKYKERNYYANFHSDEALMKELRKEWNKYDFRKYTLQNSNVKISILCPGPVKTNFNKVAHVKFDIKSVSSDYVAKYAIDKMFKNKLVIIPTVYMKALIFFSKLSPTKLAARIAFNIQDKKR